MHCYSTRSAAGSENLKEIAQRVVKIELLTAPLCYAIKPPLQFHPEPLVWWIC